MDLQAPLSPSAASSAYSRHMTCQMSYLLVCSLAPPYIYQGTVCDAYQYHEGLFRVAALRCKGCGHTESQRAVLRAGNDQALPVSLKASDMTFAIDIDIPALYNPPQHIFARMRQGSRVQGSSKRNAEGPIRPALPNLFMSLVNAFGL